MSTKSLDSFILAPKVEAVKEVFAEPTSSTPVHQTEAVQEPEKPQELVPRDLPPSFFVSATYDGDRHKVCLKLYEPTSNRIYFWYDTTGHRPYCFTNIPPNELEKIGRLVSHPGFDHFETVERYDALLDKKVSITKIVAKDPLAIGGRPK
ncbi:MAG: hypothetical protein FJ045_04560, partial [Crenarchaeota archaeon]|nr:hypothetical protein [Thermoproteota archaeon]